MSAQDLCLNNSPGEFSILEHVCHLRGIEVEGYAPCGRRILSEEKPALADIDGSKLAMERDYNERILRRRCKSFRKRETRTSGCCKALSENQLNREGDLEGMGTITLWQLLKLQREHDEEHLRELGILFVSKSPRITI